MPPYEWASLVSHLYQFARVTIPKFMYRLPNLRCVLNTEGRERKEAVRATLTQVCLRSLLNG